MRVLIACEYSGTVRDAFAALGHDAWSCDLLDGQGARIGYVSYNGKVWSGDWGAETAVCIFNPYGG